MATSVERSQGDVGTTALTVRVFGSPTTAMWTAVAAGADTHDFELTSEPATQTTLLIACTPRGVDALRAMLLRGDALLVRDLGRRATAPRPAVNA